METKQSDHSSPEGSKELVKRRMPTRIACSIAWFMVIFLVTEMIIGLFVGLSVTDGQMTFEEGFEAGVAGEELITTRYWWVILAGQVSIWLALSVLGKLPGTTRLRRAKGVPETIHEVQ